MKWKLRWAAAERDIWRPSDLLVAFRQVGFSPSLSKVAAMWSGKPVTVRLDDLDRMCAALGCQVSDLLEAEPHEAQLPADVEQTPKAVGAESSGAVRPVPRAGRSPRSLPPN